MKLLTVAAIATGVMGAQYNGCSDTQQSDLVTAASDAQNYAAEASSYVDSLTSGTERYTTWFGTYTSSRHSTVASHFDNINSHDMSAYTFDCTCTNITSFGYVHADQFGEIYLCGAFWNAPATGTDSKAGVLVRLSSQFTINGGTQDHANGRAACQQLATSNPDQAVFNADSHQYFAENNPPLP